MTIGKKLYVNFGIILAMVVVMFLVNWSAVQRAHAAKKAAQDSLDLEKATNDRRCPHAGYADFAARRRGA